jgi:hypothetical protein
MTRSILCLALAALVAGVAACSLSYSSESLSKSVSSPFTSSSGSSGGKADAAYLDEVRSFSAGFATSGGDATAFRRGLGSIAERRGIHDWEDDDATCKAIGQGLKRAGLTQDKAKALLGDLFAGRSDRAAVAMKGFDAGE